MKWGCERGGNLNNMCVCVCVCLELGERERGIIYSKEKGDKGRGGRRGGVACIGLNCGVGEVGSKSWTQMAMSVGLHEFLKFWILICI